MPTSKKSNAAHATIFLLAEIKAAVEAFDRGEKNACDVVDAITYAVHAYRAAAKTPRKAA